MDPRRCGPLGQADPETGRMVPQPELNLMQNSIDAILDKVFLSAGLLECGHDQGLDPVNVLLLDPLQTDGQARYSMIEISHST